MMSSSCRELATLPLSDSGSDGLPCLVVEEDCTAGVVTRRTVDMCDAFFDV